MLVPRSGARCATAPHCPGASSLRQVRPSDAGALRGPESCTPTPAAVWSPTMLKASATICPAPLWTSSSAGWVLKALEPASLQLSLQASERLEKEREELDGLWHKRLERAAYQADRRTPLPPDRAGEPAGSASTRPGVGGEARSSENAPTGLPALCCRAGPSSFGGRAREHPLGWRGTYPHCGTLRARRWPSARR